MLPVKLIVGRGVKADSTILQLNNRRNAGKVAADTELKTDGCIDYLLTIFPKASNPDAMLFHQDKPGTLGSRILGLRI